MNGSWLVGRLRDRIIAAIREHLGMRYTPSGCILCGRNAFGTTVLFSQGHGDKEIPLAKGQSCGTLKNYFVVNSENCWTNLRFAGDSRSCTTLQQFFTVSLHSHKSTKRWGQLIGKVSYPNWQPQSPGRIYRCRIWQPNTWWRSWNQYGQNGRLFTGDILRCMFLNANLCILMEISLKFVPKGPIDNNSESV